MKTIKYLLVTIALSASSAMAIDQNQYWSITRGKDASEVMMIAGAPDVRHRQEYTRCNSGNEGWRELWQYRGHGSLNGKTVSVKICGGKVESADTNFLFSQQKRGLSPFFIYRTSTYISQEKRPLLGVL